MKILLVRFSSLGDVILTTGVAKFIKESMIDAEIDILTYTEFKDIFINNKYITNVISVDRKKGLWNYLKFIGEKINGYEYIFDLQRKFRSRLLAFFTDAKYFSYESCSFKRRIFVKYRWYKEELSKHVAERYFSCVNRGLDINVKSLEDIRPYINIESKRDVDGVKRVVIHPFASKQTKVWPYFAELASKLIEYGFKVSVIGDGKFPTVNGVENFTGKIELNRLLQHLAEGDIFVGTDSGPMHAAAAMNVPVVAIFGSTTKEFGFFPLFKGCQIIQNNNLKCRPCHVHGLDTCPEKHFNCMKNISVGEVFDTMIKVIKGHR